ncbi:lysine transporter LysE [Endozoicomonas sp. OPT23]|uniref:LysE family translocator n=1 Tax=Endozoicomonas sp. OPT23 TaxID=2072845 RepID=UPI00129A5DA0|nr:LysE family translocator [Endozoicomonas sp. OPT23]MRI32865.1 lysine transporter LysE [Endozoicomonas sp. OPT23]
MFDLELLWLPLVAFAFATSVTPGPNNIMLTSSGLNFGFIRTIPHMLGISVGFFVMFCCVAFGLHQVFEQFPILQEMLRLIGVVYMLRLAWLIATSGKVETGKSQLKPMTFIQAALFQFVNAKAVMMAVSAVAVFALPGDQFAKSAVIVGVVFSLVNLPSVSIWAAFGAAIGKLLTDDRKLKQFNYGLATLTAASVALFFI